MITKENIVEKSKRWSNNHNPKEYGISAIRDKVTGKIVDVGTEKELEEKLEKTKVTAKLIDSYNQIKDILRFYLDLNEDYYSLIALWIIGTYFHDNFESFPYLFFNAMRGSGKSKTLRLVCKLSNDGNVMASPTEATLFRTFGTLGIDEFEGVANKDKGSVRELLNGAYKKGILIQRMKKTKGIAGEDYVVENFEVFRPIIMANIWGMEEVLGDRCLTLILEKSDDDMKTRLTEDFENNKLFENVQKTLKECSLYMSPKELKYPNLGTSGLKKAKCSLCSVVSLGNVNTTWNNYISNKHHTTLTTHTTHTTLHTLTTPNNNQKKLFDKIYDSGIKGRNLELFLPLCFIAEFIGDKVLEELLEIAIKITNDKKHEEETESIDVMVYDFISKQPSGLEFFSVKQLTEQFKTFSDEAEDWLNTKWFGRALKRLGLILSKRRKGYGVEVMLNVVKAKNKLLMFQTKEKDDKPKNK